MPITNEMKILILAGYIAVISLISICVTCYDKRAAKKNPRHRVSENMLILLSALGGSIAMYVTMQTIRHKTKHMKFMVGIPIIIILQMIAVFFVCKYIFPGIV